MKNRNYSGRVFAGLALASALAGCTTPKGFEGTVYQLDALKRDSKGMLEVQTRDGPLYVPAGDDEGGVALGLQNGNQRGLYVFTGSLTNKSDAVNALNTFGRTNDFISVTPGKKHTPLIPLTTEKTDWKGRTLSSQTNKVTQTKRAWDCNWEFGFQSWGYKPNKKKVILIYSYISN